MTSAVNREGIGLRGMIRLGPWPPTLQVSVTRVRMLTAVKRRCNAYTTSAGDSRTCLVTADSKVKLLRRQRLARLDQDPFGSGYSCSLLQHAAAEAEGPGSQEKRGQNGADAGDR